MLLAAEFSNEATALAVHRKGCCSLNIKSRTPEDHKLFVAAPTVDLMKFLFLLNFLSEPASSLAVSFNELVPNENTMFNH